MIWKGNGMKYFGLAIAAVTLIVSCASSGSKGDTAVQKEPFDSTYAAWAGVLQSFIHGELVDYGGLKAKRAGLDSTIRQLAGLSADRFKTMSRDEQMALWINAYNAITLRSIVDAYPVSSIKEINGVWDKKKWLVAGREVTLNEIEHKILRPEFKDPRVHFAVNCASIGCPPLKPKPFAAETLDQQLSDAASTFVNHPTRNKFNSSDGTITSSEIFSWFAEDFLPFGNDQTLPSLSKEETAVFNFIRSLANDSLAASLDSRRQWSLAYAPYDWSLNDTAN